LILLARDEPVRQEYPLPQKSGSPAWILAVADQRFNDAERAIDGILKKLPTTIEFA
jgi:hypothetical protein